jgi:hypothetical protein
MEQEIPMELIRLEPQLEAEPLDAATHAALDEAEAEVARGETVSLEQSNINLRKRLQAWKKAQEAVPTA